jgi:hypothetical protein
VEGAWWLPRSSKPLRGASRPGWVRFPYTPATAPATTHLRRPTVIRRPLARLAPLALVVACAVLGLAAEAPARLAHAQRADSARAGAAPARDRALRPPLSPRRAFLTSLVAPGYAQSVLGRPNAAAFFILTEAIGLLMVRESAIELREARRLQDDSVALHFVDPLTGVPDTVYRPARYPEALVRARRAHLEDWIAALVANHLIAAADAFVAAHLWEVPVRVGLRRAAGGAVLAARYRW